MSRISLSLSFLAVLAFAVSLSGCGDQGDKHDSKPVKQDSAADHADRDHGDHGDHDDHDHGDHDNHANDQENGDEHAGIAEALAELSAADRAAAEKQKICPVSGELLGLMGTPRKVTVNGREVFVCCRSCEKTIKKDPDKYLAKLK